MTAPALLPVGGRTGSSEAQIAATLALLPIPAAATSLGGSWQYANGAFCALVGRSLAELRTLHREDVVHPEDRGRARAYERRLLDGDIASYQVALRLVTKDGAAVWMWATAGMLRDAAGVPRTILLSFTPMTAEEERDEAEATSAPRPFAPPAAPAVTPAPPAPPPPPPPAPFPAPAPSPARDFADVTEPAPPPPPPPTGGPWRPTPPVPMTAVTGADALRMPAGGAPASGATPSDPARTRLLALLGHELRTPLNAIRGYAEMLLQGARGPITEAQRSDLQRITQAERHLLRLANDVLALTSIESGRLAYRQGRVSVARAFEEALTLVTPQARAKGVHMHAEPTSPELVVRADSDKLRQVLVNLLSNAIKYTPTGGTVAVYGAWEGEMVAMHVRDTGRGIPPEMRERIFEPFVRLPDAGSSEPAPHGVGLGLAISRGLARGMGGELTVESAPGVGSTFRLVVPVGDGEGGGM